MRSRKWILEVLVLIFGATASVILPNLIFALQLALALRSLASGAAGENLPVVLKKVQGTMRGRPLEALVYRPRDFAPRRALIFAAGISELGCYHPRFMALCRYLSNKGFLVVTPDIVAFRRFEITAEPIDQIVYWFQQVSSLEGGSGVNHTGLAGISFSATLSLIAAARPEIRDEVSFLLGIGAYYDLNRCFRHWFARSSLTLPEGYYPTRFYAKWIIMNAALGMLPAERDRMILHKVLMDLLLQQKAPPEDPGLTPEGGRWYRIAVMREDQSDDELSREIEDYLTPVLFRQLDPEQAAAEVRCPVFLVHGAYDDLIPPEESLELKRHITGAPCCLLISPFLTHTHPLAKTFSWKQKAVAAVQSIPFFYRFAEEVR